jgi:hypothetical protein
VKLGPPGGRLTVKSMIKLNMPIRNADRSLGLPENVMSQLGSDGILFRLCVPPLLSSPYCPFPYFSPWRILRYERLVEIWESQL